MIWLYVVYILLKLGLVGDRKRLQLHACRLAVQNFLWKKSSFICIPTAEKKWHIIRSLNNTLRQIQYMLFGHLSWDLTGYYWWLSVIQQLDSGACQNNTFIFHDFIKQEKRRKGKSRQHQESSQGVSFRVPCWIISPFIHKMAIKAQEESGSTEISTKPTLCLSTEYQSPYYFAFR